MKRLLELIPALLSLYVLMLAVGCEDDETLPRTIPSYIVRISAEPDSVPYSQWGYDTSSMLLSIRVTDSLLHPQRGVTVALDRPSAMACTCWEYANQALRDTTDANGLVRFNWHQWFWCHKHFHYYIRASVLGASDSVRINWDQGCGCLTVGG